MSRNKQDRDIQDGRAIVGALYHQDHAKATQSLAETMRRLKAVTGGVLITEEEMYDFGGYVDQHGNVHNQVVTAANAPAPYRAPKSGGMRPAMVGEWRPVLVVKELAGGKSKEVWQVRGPGVAKIDFDFRHEIVAATAAAAINETNNVNDNRVTRLIQLSTQETRLLSEARKAKTLMESGDKKGAASLKDLKAQLAKVRAVLGVKS